MGRQIDKCYGWTFNLDSEMRRLDMIARSENFYRRACSGPKNIFRDDEACTFGRPRTLGSYDIAIFGDAYANAYGIARGHASPRGGQLAIADCCARTSLAYRDGGHLNRIGAEHLWQSMRLPEVRPRQ